MPTITKKIHWLGNWPPLYDAPPVTVVLIGKTITSKLIQEGVTVQLPGDD